MANMTTAPAFTAATIERDTFWDRDDHSAAELRERLRVVLMDEAVADPLRRSPATILWLVDLLVAQVRREGLAVVEGGGHE